LFGSLRSQVCFLFPSIHYRGLSGKINSALKKKIKMA
jgi:hypothetical protein